MSATYGPIIFTNFGVVQQVNINQATIAMIVENQSLYDCLFSVNQIQPQTITQATAAALINSDQAIVGGGWDLHIGPREAGVLQVPASSLTAAGYAGGYWTGTVFVQLVDVTNSDVVGGSFVSNPGANVWITAYGPDEKIPDAGITSIGYFLANQGRNVSVPVGGSYTLSTLVTASAQNVWINLTTPTSIGNLPFSNPAITAGITPSASAVAVLYNAFVSMYPLSAAAGTAEGQSVSLRLAFYDSSLSTIVVATNTLFGAYLAHLALQSTSNAQYNPSNPIYFFCQGISAGAGPPYYICPQYLISTATGGGGTNIKPVQVSMVFDVAAAAPFGSGGGLIGISSGSVYNGFVY